MSVSRGFALRDRIDCFCEAPLGSIIGPSLCLRGGVEEAARRAVEVVVRRAGVVLHSPSPALLALGTGLMGFRTNSEDVGSEGAAGKRGAFGGASLGGGGLACS
eukprot:CAMPEP_0195034404 /NCGR_PEP_ID=MMETSP0326_2-20130528/67787_1 /TAXON_ID=2866 ORGANISM="Crypthecodinium cohnii, Strain Seligo" /NCGR_SAMPLE_ID=MMETSP0326_2 /ASSEMBLY_ACC=CAM_ASM_000348 /LENGTH=103 /DNA_ID=CAMNT_0040059225 /DNA_START=129 /DNA_END=436 /DNA_ORIENTATION=+